MPKPKPDETHDDFMDRCIPQVIDEGKDPDQAVAICESLWEGGVEQSSYLIRQSDTDEPFWYWDAASNRYRDASGQFVSATRVRELAIESIQASAVALDPLASFVSNQLIDRDAWRSIFRENVKDEFIRQYVAGIGGRQNMTPADWGRVGRMLRDQYAFIDGFYDNILDKSEAQIRAQMQQYMASAHQAFERARGQTALKWGATEVFWNIDPAVENCEDCIARAAFGWQPIGANGGYVDQDGVEAFPADGQTICLANCACGLLYRNEEGRVFSG